MGRFRLAAIATVLALLALPIAYPRSADAAPFDSGAFALLAGTGPVAAYSMDQGAGASVADISGNGNTGTLSGPAWSPNGKFGSALSFSGSSLVTIPDSSSLDLTTALTEEARVQPTALGGAWRTVLFKER